MRTAMATLPVRTSTMEVEHNDVPEPLVILVLETLFDGNMVDAV